MGKADKKVVKNMGLATRKHKSFDGEDIKNVAQAMIEKANSWGAKVYTNFNGIELVATPGDKVGKIITLYCKLSMADLCLLDIQILMRSLSELITLRKNKNGRVIIDDSIKNRLGVLHDMINIVLKE